MRRWTVALPVVISLVGLSVIGMGWHVCAQPGEQPLRQGSGQIWSEPVNLSHSGAASKPVVIVGPDGAPQAFWWDQLDGLTTARWQDGQWSPAVASPIYTHEEIRGEWIAVPIEVMPHLTADVDGWVHALWLGEPDEETGASPLLHSRLEIGDTTWPEPNVVAPSALIWDLGDDLAGTLHLAYVQSRHSDASPAGVYYAQSTDGGRSWSAPQILYRSMYFRLLSTEEAQVHVATDGEGRVYVTWDDPRLENAFYARSIDGGISWEESRAVGNPEEGAKQVYVVFGQQRKPLFLWQAIRAVAPCALYQQHVDGGGMPRRVLEELGTCPDKVRFLRTTQGRTLLVTDNGGGGLTLAAWDSDTNQWSEPKWLSLSFEDSELGRQVYLEFLWVTLVGDALAVVGQGQDGDVWFLESQMSALEWAYEPPSPWSEPVELSQSEGLPGLPAIATDAEGRVHVLWSESAEEGLPGKRLYYADYNGTRWTQPVEVLRSIEGKAEQPALLAVGDRLHAVWSGGQSGEILYSRSYIRDAYAPDGWSEPQPLPALSDVGGWPAIAIDPTGRLHVVYAVPLNEGRGIYHTRSDDGGGTWSKVEVVFDAAAAGWPMVDHPSLAVDERGTLHVAWVRAPLPGSGLPESIYYVRSSIEGEAPRSGSEQAWSEPVQIAEGAYDWPRVVATPGGLVHLLWDEASGSLGWIHQRSTDGGAGWTRPERVGRFAGLAGPVGLVGNGARTLHLVGVGHDDAGESALLYTTWTDERWGDLKTFRLPTGTSGEPGAAVALQSALGQLDVILRVETVGEDGETQMDVLYTSRSIPPTEVTPVSVLIPQPTMTPTPWSPPQATPTPHPAVSAVPPPPAPPALSLGPVTLPLASLGGLLLAALIVVVVAVLALRPLSVWRR